MARRHFLLPLLALAPLLAPWSLVAQSIVEPDPAEVAAGLRDLRKIESDFINRLNDSPSDSQLAAELGRAMHAEWRWRLDHPDPLLRKLIATAQDSGKLAFQIVGNESGTYDTDLLLTALTVQPERTALWVRAAQTTWYASYRIAFLARALETLMRPQGELRGAAGELAVATAIAGQEIATLLERGLGRDALSTFDALPAVVRERIGAGETGRITLEGLEIQSPDLRLDLAAARLLEGDRAGAEKLLARAPGPAWHPGAPPPSPLRNDDATGLKQALLRRWLAGPGRDDPFPLLSTLASSLVFQSEAWRRAVPVSILADLAAREGYPEIAAFARHRAEGEMWDDAADEEPGPVAPGMQRAISYFHAAIAAQRERAVMAAEAAARVAEDHTASFREVVGEAWTAVSVTASTLAVLDRQKRHGLVLWSAGCASGGYRLDQREDRWAVTTIEQAE